MRTRREHSKWSVGEHSKSPVAERNSLAGADNNPVAGDSISLLLACSIV
ncbi:MAG TPA: hypothetical protein VLA12_03185 [Planctomycetaceae bacterium]|nr:hypothetical protein [Planctomycetaceae bacterium]